MTAPTAGSTPIHPAVQAAADDHAERAAEIEAARDGLKAAIRAAAPVLGDRRTRDLLCDWMAGNRLLQRVRGGQQDYDRAALDRAIQETHDAHHGDHAPNRFCGYDLCRAFRGVL